MFESDVWTSKMLNCNHIVIKEDSLSLYHFSMQNV